MSTDAQAKIDFLAPEHIMSSIFPIEIYENIVRVANSPSVLNLFARTCWRIANLAAGMSHDFADKWTLHKIRRIPIGEEVAVESRSINYRHQCSTIFRECYGFDATLYADYDRGRPLRWMIVRYGEESPLVITYGSPRSHITLVRRGSVESGFSHTIYATYEGITIKARLHRRRNTVNAREHESDGTIFPDRVVTKPSGYLIDDVYQPDVISSWYEREIGQYIKLQPICTHGRKWKRIILAHFPDLI